MLSGSSLWKSTRHLRQNANKMCLGPELTAIKDCKKMSKYAKAEQHKHLRKVNAGKTTRLVQMTGTENQFLFIRC